MVNAHRIPLFARALAALALAAATCAPLRSQVGPGDLFPLEAIRAASPGSLPAVPARAVLVDFWASWCGPCRASFPAYSRLQADYGARGLAVVAVGVDDEASDFARFVAALKPSFATFRDAGHAIVSRVQVPTMPTSYLVDRRGRVRFMHPGFHGAQTEALIRREVEGLLAEKEGAP